MRRVALGAVVVAAVALASPARAAFEDCSPPGALVPEVGRVACHRMASAALGGVTAFSYYVPPACAAGPCPVLYLLHGFGGDYRSMLRTADAPSAWVRALSAGPVDAQGRPVDPNHLPDPYSPQYADPSRWSDAAYPDLDLILVAPHGRTLPGGYGPQAGLDSFWADWNPRYAGGVVYDTPPPRFETHLLSELIPFVEASFRTPGGRRWRAISGVSLGGYGAYKDALQHPDTWASAGSVSGAHNFLFAPATGPVGSSPAGLQPPVPLPAVAVPGAAPRGPWLGVLPPPAQGFAAAFYAFGDPVADEAFYRGNMPVDLAANARARGAGGEASLRLRAFVNDAVPRRAEDLASPASYAVAQAFEALVLPMNADLEAAFSVQGVERTFEVHPGLHSGTYWNAFLRKHLEAQREHLRAPGPEPEVFDYRSVAAEFSVWGWRVTVRRPTVEFLNLSEVSCRGLVLRGSGLVTVSVPSSCGTGLDGAATFTVDLGPPQPTDEHAGVGSLPAYGRTVRVELTPR